MPMLVPLVVAALEVYGGVALATTGIEAGLMIAGGAMTAVGALTGNKNLQMIGGIVGLGAGLAGGVAGAASEGLTAGDGFAGMGDVGDASQLPASLSDTAPVNAAVTSSSPGLIAGEQSTDASLGGLGSAGAPPTPQVDPNALAGAPPGDAAAPVVPTADSSPMAGANGTGTTDVGAPTSPGTQAATNYSDYGSPTGPGAPGTSSVNGAAPTGPGVAPSSAPTPAANQSWFGQLQDSLGKGAAWAQANPGLTKVAGGLVSGAMNYYGSQQLADSNLERAKKYQDWARQRYSDSVRNLQTPTLSVTRAPSSGIINGARP